MKWQTLSFMKICSKNIIEKVTMIYGRINSLHEAYTAKEKAQERERR